MLYRLVLRPLLYAMPPEAAHHLIMRLMRGVAAEGRLREDEAGAWCDAYAFIQLLRMRHHQAQERVGLPLDNHVDPDTLNELDRRILREAFRQARKLQARIALDYGL